MTTSCIIVEQSPGLRGECTLTGAKNATLPILASLILTAGVSRLSNVPRSHDVMYMIHVLERLGARVTWLAHAVVEIDTASLDKWCVEPEIMKKMRASILVMGALLARFGRADIALPGGCVIGARPVNYHLEALAKMGTTIELQGDFLYARASHLKPATIIMEYPSVGATENIMMAAVRTRGTTRIVNAALEPEVLDLIRVLRAMGASIDIQPPATIVIEGVTTLHPVEHHIIYDRLEAGALLAAVAITGGSLSLPQAPAYALELFLMKLQEMGHSIDIGPNQIGVALKACTAPKAVNFKTGPYPSFPTDLQAPMMALQTVAQGVSIVEETVFENRMHHSTELQKMGAAIRVDGHKAYITGVDELYGTRVIAADIRASCSLVLAGLVAKGATIISGVHHWRRGYDNLEGSLRLLGASVRVEEVEDPAVTPSSVYDVSIAGQTARLQS